MKTKHIKLNTPYSVLRTINIFNFPASLKPGLETAARMVFKNTKLAHDGLNLVLVPDREIVRINRKYLKRNRVTDIISFTLSEKPLSGDIYISKEQSKKQAKQAGHSWGHELLYLAIHGFLHLLDHRDYTAAQKKKMFAIQDKIFNEVVRVKG